MPNVNPPFQNLSLDPAEMIAVNEAYDMACRTLQNIGSVGSGSRNHRLDESCKPQKPASGTPTNYASMPSMD